MTTSGKTTLSTMMGSYPKTAPLKEGKIDSPLLQLDFAPVEVAQTAFKDVVRRQKYDVAELAIVTFLLAYEAGKPYVMLPFVMNGQFHHKSMVVREDSGLQPDKLQGKAIAMRSWSQTTPTWVRGILMHEYGLKLQDARWLSQEAAHVEEYHDPEWITQLDAKVSLEELLRAGAVDVVLGAGGMSGNPGLRPLVPKPAEAALAWHERTHCIPINHVVTVRREIADTQPEFVREIYRMLQASRAASGQGAGDKGPDLQPVGFEKLQPSLTMAIGFAFEQGLIRKRYTVEELYGNVINVLG